MSGHLAPLWTLRWTAVATLALVAATWPLWILSSEFPVIPLLPGVTTVPRWVDWSLLAMLIGSLAIVAAGPSWCRSGPVCLAFFSGVGLVVLSQQRLQPWFYYLLLVLIISRVEDRSWQLRWMRRLVVSLYFFSAVGKFDYEFLHTVGQQFVGVLYRWVGFAPPDSPRILLAACLPLGELMLAVGLLWPATRRGAGVLAGIFHGGLLLVLSPIGLGHSLGVVLWNLAFAIQAPLLFTWPRTIPPAHAHGVGRTLVAAIVVAAILLPVTERWSVWDHWPSWALYAPHSSRAKVWVAQTTLDRLPESLQRQFTSSELEEIWVSVPLDRWSLAETGAPLYPQARFQVGLARHLAQRVDSRFAIGMRLESPASRWSGARRVLEIEGSQQIQAAGNRFWLNTLPRNFHYEGDL